MSEYCSATEIAQKWGLSGRRVGLLCAQERIPGATKIGKTWMIPADATKPSDPRREKQPPEIDLPSDLADIIKATATPWPSRNPDAILDTVSEKRLRLQYEGELAYLRGNFARIIECFYELGNDDAAKLRACSLTIVAAISAGDYSLYLELENHLKGVVKANISGEVSAIAEQALATGYLSAIAPNMVSDWLKDGNFKAIPPLARPDAAYKRAKYFQCVGNFEAMLTVAQTALAFSDSEDEISITGTYLRMACAIARYELEQPDEAERYLLDLMRICLPHGFITPFAETMTVFGGMIERLLGREYPACYDAVIGQWESTVFNWIDFHNRFTKNNITRILSRREVEIAILAARGVPYKKIAEQFNLSAGTLKNIVSIICEKLLINGRDRKKELAKFVSMTKKS